MLDPYVLNHVLDSLSFGISEFHLRMLQICRPKLGCVQKPNEVFVGAMWSDVILFPECR
jgi:hypothetical protein